jgi:hypothetical protein
MRLTLKKTGTVYIALSIRYYAFLNANNSKEETISREQTVLIKQP